MKTTTQLMNENREAKLRIEQYKNPGSWTTQKLLLPMAFVVFIVSVLAFVI